MNNSSLKIAKKDKDANYDSFSRNPLNNNHDQAYAMNSKDSVFGKSLEPSELEHDSRDPYIFGTHDDGGNRNDIVQG